MDSFTEDELHLIIGLSRVKRGEILQSTGFRTDEYNRLLVITVKAQRQISETYGYTVEDEDGQDVDSCWGFIGSEYVEQEAKSAAQAHIQAVSNA